MSQDIRNFFQSSDKKQKELKSQLEESEVIAFNLNQKSAEDDPFFKDMHSDANFSLKASIGDNNSTMPINFFEDRGTKPASNFQLIT